MSRLERVDLRLPGACFPYLQPSDQGNQVSCVAHAMASALYCLKARRGLAVLPETLRGHPATQDLFGPAVARSQRPRQGTSFGDVLREVLRRHGPDLDALGCHAVYLENDPESLRAVLRRGLPIVAGYQVCDAIEQFHASQRVCEAHGFLLPGYSKPSVSAHCVLILGFDDATETFIARNSWGASWGVEGHFLIRYRDVSDSDFFTDLLVLDCEGP